MQPEMMAVKADVSTSDASDGLHLTSPLLAELRKEVEASEDSVGKRSEMDTFKYIQD